MGILGVGIKAVERGWVFDALIRAGIRRLCSQRLKKSREDSTSVIETEFLSSMNEGPIAPVPELANDQHYEVPAEFFQLVLGPRAKYSSCYFKDSDCDLAQAETESLEITCRRAQLRNGQNVLELGCGWGSLSLFMAERFPNSTFTAVSNSNSQRKHIESVCLSRGLKNLNVITADMNDFSPSGQFDRIVSVEMFEHMRNYRELLAKVASWLESDGKLFVHIFCHREFCYPFETGGDSNWMGKYFFTGGLMPSQNIFQHFKRDMAVEKQYRWNGLHYQRTLDSWLANMDANRNVVLNLFGDVYGRSQAIIWFNRWRVFFMACSELFGFDGGNEWFVSHYLLSPVKRNSQIENESRGVAQV